MARLVFPENLGTDLSMSHWMNINAYPAGQVNRINDTISLFIPGGPQNGSLSWKTVNDYAEISMTKLGPSAIAIGNFAAQLAGGAINPKVEVLFRTTQLRQFQFNFMFAPSSREESENMEKIIKTLRGHAAPEIDNNDPMGPYIGGGGGVSIGGLNIPVPTNQAQYLTSGLGMKAPSEFTIDFYREGGQINEHIPKIARSIIERIDVDYAPQGEFSTFSNGYPVSAMLTVVFREMRIIDRSSILNRGF